MSQGEHKLSSTEDRCYLTVRGYLRGAHSARGAALEALEFLASTLGKTSSRVEELEKEVARADNAIWDYAANEYTEGWISEGTDLSLRPQPGETEEQVIERVLKAVKDEHENDDPRLPFDLRRDLRSSEMS